MNLIINLWSLKQVDESSKETVTEAEHGVVSSDRNGTVSDMNLRGIANLNRKCIYMAFFVGLLSLSAIFFSLEKKEWFIFDQNFFRTD